LEGKETSEVLPEILRHIRDGTGPAEADDFDKFAQRHLLALQNAVGDEDPGEICAIVTHAHNMAVTLAWLKAGGKPGYEDKDEKLTFAIDRDSLKRKPETDKPIVVIWENNQGRLGTLAEIRTMPESYGFGMTEESLGAEE
jgi:hypothetical protein